MKTLRVLLFLLVLSALFLLSLYKQDPILSGNIIHEEAVLTRVIDGDTIEVEINGQEEKIRLLSINTPEKGRKGYDEASMYLEQYLDQDILLESLDEDNREDQYKRQLRYVYHDNELLNAEILEKGLATLYYYNADAYTDKLAGYEASARDNGLGVWQKSQDICAECVVLKDIENGEKKDDSKAGSEYIEIMNICSFDCSLEGYNVKDDASHYYEFDDIILAKESYIRLYNGQGQDTKEELFWQNKGKANIWNDDHDSLFLRDREGMLVLFYRY